jgi:photosystem II stability/assembly factor-like uncharacterized protein
LTNAFKQSIVDLVNKVVNIFLRNLFHTLLFGIVLASFSFLAPHSYAASFTLVGLSGTAVEQIAVDPTNSNTIYAAAPNVGIYKTTDAGANWSAINNGLSDPQYHNYFDIAIDPTDHNVLYLVSRGSAQGNSHALPGVFKSTDGGANWADISPNVTSGYSAFKVIAIDPNNHNTVYLGSANHCNGIWKTTDGGSNWSQSGTPNCDITSLVVDPSNSNNVYAGESTFYKSTDGGANWSSVDPNVFGNLGAGAVAIDLTSTGVLYVGTGYQGDLYKSTDGGTNWTLDSAYPGGAPGEGHTLITDPNRPNAVYVANSGDSLVASSTDGGTTFSNLTLPDSTIALGLLTPVNNSKFLYAGTTDGVYAYELPSTRVLALNSGGSTQGSFVSDTDFSGGTTYPTTTSVDLSGVTNPAPQAVYQTVRYGNFTYTIPNLTANAHYTVRLHFNELYWTTVGSRVFNVSVNGTQALSNYDIYAEAGGANKAVVEQLPATADSNGNIAIQFTTVVDNAMVNGIELYGGTLPSPSPITSEAVNAGGSTVSNFLSDTDYSGGQPYTSTASVDLSGVTNPAPESVYQSVRYGNLTYTFPHLAPNTSYNVRLHFNELYWGTSLAGGNGGTGSRVFNVSINGSNVLSNFDIYQTAGGANKAIVEPFTTTSDSNGKITIVFTTVTDNAMVNGIELSQ